MVKQTKKEKQLKAFLVTFSLENEEDLKSVVVIAYDKKDACTIFTRWASGKNLYDKMNAVCAQLMRKSKRNAHIISEEYYKRQNDFVNKLLEKVSIK